MPGPSASASGGCTTSAPRSASSAATCRCTRSWPSRRARRTAWRWLGRDLLEHVKPLEARLIAAEVGVHHLVVEQIDGLRAHVEARPLRLEDELLDGRAVDELDLHRLRA